MLPGSVPFGNWSQTNIVFTSSGGWFDSLLLLPAGLPEPPRGAPAGTRFVMAFDDEVANPTGFRALQIAVSPDGFSFSVLSKLPDTGNSFADTSVSLSYDPTSREFVAFGRYDGSFDTGLGHLYQSPLHCQHFPAPCKHLPPRDTPCGACCRLKTLVLAGGQSMYTASFTPAGSTAIPTSTQGSSSAGTKPRTTTCAASGRSGGQRRPVPASSTSPSTHN